MAEAGTRDERGMTVAALARQVVGDRRVGGDWLRWPPDLFAFTSVVQRETGCYRCAVAEPWPRHGVWEREAQDAAHEWIERVNAHLIRHLTGRLPADGRDAGDGDAGSARDRFRVLAGALRTLHAHWDRVTLDELRVLDTAEAKELARALLTLHVIADDACTGFGLIGPIHPSAALARCLANLLLAATGSLSTIPKVHGVVLPKMRTPQSGLTLRSLSHQVTFHTTEVEVTWRTVPWANVHENTINMLLVPWPGTVEDRCFEAGADTFETVRYFRYAPPGLWDSGRLHALVDRIVKDEREIGRLHVVVLPELALGRKDFRALLTLLRIRHEAPPGTAGRLVHVPLVIAGVQRLETRDGTSEALNEVLLAAYFAGKWYELSQLKHHRWKLDRNQIRQYGLEGRLSTARSWYEETRILQRRLTFLAPNGWLTLCPLICEDLAQLEPVSDVIRGVGPTLLTALLMDGPQLKARWSARYASVLADDPGTAVLTLSSWGMVRRSRLLDGSPPPPADAPRTVALWKDQLAGWQPLDVRGDDEALLLTIAATWREEFTADGRGDGAFASLFQYEGVRPAPLAPEARASEPPPEGPWGDWSDIRELTAAYYVVDCLLSLRGRYSDYLVSWLLAEPKADGVEREPRFHEMLRRMTRALRDPATVGIRAESQRWPTPGLTHAACIIAQWAEVARDGPDDERPADYWRRLTDEAERRLTVGPTRGDPCEGAMAGHDGEGMERTHKAASLMVLFALHARVEMLRRARGGAAGGGRSAAGPPGLARLLGRIEELLATHA